MKSILKESRKALALIAIATALLIIALQMAQAQNHWTETIQTPVSGTKGRNAAIGAAGGGILGGIAAFVIGGVGVVAMGTGIGAPAGVGLIALATTVGAGGGAVVGAATGKSGSTSVTTIMHSAPAYESWQWILLFAIGAVLALSAIAEINAARKRAQVIHQLA